MPATLAQRLAQSARDRAANVRRFAIPTRVTQVTVLDNEGAFAVAVISDETDALHAGEDDADFLYSELRDDETARWESDGGALRQDEGIGRSGYAHAVDANVEPGVSYLLRRQAE